MKVQMNKSFLKNYILLFFIIVSIFSAFSIYTYRNSKNVIEEELTKSSFQNLENTGAYIDRFITDTKYMISSLVVSDAVQFILSAPSSEFVINNNYQRRVQELLQALEQSNKAIEAIYFYAADTEIIYLSNSTVAAASYSDTLCLDQLNPDRNGISVFPYAMFDSFPYTICVAKSFDVNGHQSVICFMLNLANLPLVQEKDTNYQQFFIVSDEADIIYSYRQRALKTPLADFDALAHCDPSLAEKVGIYDGKSSTPYSLSQVHSSVYPWSYALYTPLQDYVSRLTSAKAITLSIFFLFVVLFAFITILFLQEAIKPLRRLRNLLDSSELLTSGSQTSASDIDYIAGKITQYVQTNRQLADELDSRLNLLKDTQKQSLQLQINPHFLFNSLSMLYIHSVDALGFEHPLPESIQDLCTLLRYALSSDYMVSLETELKYNDIYLQTLNQRYEKQLTVHREIDPAVLSAKVPRLFIQPIIENAIYHGFSKQQDANCIISIRCAGTKRTSSNGTVQKFVVLEIADNGMGIDEASLLHIKDVLNGKAQPEPGKNIGLKNVSDRLSLFYANEATIEISSVPMEGTTFTFTLPFIS